MGKGDSSRPRACSTEQWEDNWAAAFGGDQPKRKYRKRDVGVSKPAFFPNGDDEPKPKPIRSKRTALNAIAPPTPPPKKK